MLIEGYVWTVSEDAFQQRLMFKSVELAKKNYNLPTCVITSDKNLQINVDELIVVDKTDKHPEFDFFTYLKHCPWDVLNYLSNRTMIINNLKDHLSDKKAQFIIRPNLLSPNNPVYESIKRSWFIDNSWFRISKYHVESLEYNFISYPYEDVEQPLSDWVNTLNDKTLHKDIWFPSTYRDMHEIKKFFNVPLSKNWLALPEEFFKSRPIFEIAENEHFEEFLKNGF
jgi:hypothetical protein